MANETVEKRSVDEPGVVSWKDPGLWPFSEPVHAGGFYQCPDLTRIALDPNHPRKIAWEAELLVLRPELNHIE